MTPRDNLIAALDGRRPDRIPCTVNQEFVSDDPAWDDLFAAGLCPIPYVHTVCEEMTEVERVVEPITWQGQAGRRVTLRTPHGDIHQIEVNGWVRERVQAAAPDGCGPVFEISEDLPPNWREAIPVVLETLRENA